MHCPLCGDCVSARVVVDSIGADVRVVLRREGAAP